NETVRAAVNSAALAHARQRRRLPELTARSADVLTLAPPDRGRDPGVEQDRLEAEDPGERRAAELRALPVVERDQVHLGLQVAEQAREAASVVGCVVDVLEHYVLEEDPLPGHQRLAA